MAGTHPPTVDAAAYSDYLRTVGGRLRADLAWENLREFLPPKPQRRALDVGCGTGEMALRLAGLGFQGTALDASDTMLAETKRTAAEAGLQALISVYFARHVAGNSVFRRPSCRRLANAHGPRQLAPAAAWRWLWSAWVCWRRCRA